MIQNGYQFLINDHNKQLPNQTNRAIHAVLVWCDDVSHHTILEMNEEINHRQSNYLVNFITSWCTNTYCDISMLITFIRVYWIFNEVLKQSLLSLLVHVTTRTLSGHCNQNPANKGASTLIWQFFIDGFWEVEYVSEMCEHYY